MTAIGDIYLRTAQRDHVMIVEVEHYREDIYRFRWYEIENDVYGWYTSPFGDDLLDTRHHIFEKVA